MPLDVELTIDARPGRRDSDVWCTLIGCSVARHLRVAKGKVSFDKIVNFHNFAQRVLITF